MESQLRVTFQPQGRAVHVLAGTTLLEAAARAGLVIETPCGGVGTCGKCRLRVISPAMEPTAADRRVFDADALRDGWRLACQNRVQAETTVVVPDSSLFGGGAQILATADPGAAGDLRPAIRKQYVELPRPTLEDDAPDLLRLERATGPFKTDLRLVRHVAAALRAQAFTGTAVLADHRLIGFEPGDTRGHCYGVAFDIGTTTLVGALMSLTDGRELGVVSRVNPQVVFGDDVLSRIKRAATCPGSLEEMQIALARELSAMIDLLCAEARIDRNCIYEAALAGNTTMEHILGGIDPAQLGELPFVPVHARGLLVPASDLGVPLHRNALAYLFPLIGGFVGGDTVAGMLATRMDRMEAATLLVDIGTNGEIVLAHQGRFWAASTAAGPAFEGARIACGMRGTHGAIEKVMFDGDVRLEVIGGGKPAGLCGSGLIDLVAELLRVGILTPEGQLLAGDDRPADLPPALAARVRLDAAGEAQFQLDGAVFLTQRDVREVQLGCGAIRAGIAILLEKAGLAVSDLASVLIAGGFGNFIRRSSAQRIGLLPAGIDHRRIRYVGNVSLAGARAALLSTEARRLGETLARQVRHLDLSTAADFHAAFAEAMIFPSESESADPNR